MPLRCALVLVSCNSARFLRECLDSVAGQLRPFARVVVIDNGSTDRSVEIATRPGVEVVALAENLGYAAAANLGIARCPDADVVGVANVDVVLAPDFLQAAAEALLADPDIALLSPLLLRFDGVTVDSAGQERSLSLHPRERGYGRPLPAEGFPAGAVFSVCGAVTLFTRRAIRHLLDRDGEVYDEDFFMFWEDFDVGWRAQADGLKVWFDPRVRARHYRSGTLEPGWRARFSLALARPPALRVHLAKNRLLSLIKNFRFGTDGWRIPFMVARDVLWMGSLTLTSAKTIIGLIRAAPLIRKALAKRRLRLRHP